jgi:hypothetical protein
MLLKRYGVALPPDQIEVLWMLTGFETFDILAGSDRDRDSVAATLNTALGALLELADPPPAGH